MHIHIGGGKLVDKKDVVMILDYNQLVRSADGRTAVAQMDKHAKLCRLSSGKVNSLIITKEYGGLCAYFSSIYTRTLMSRKKSAF